MSELCGNCGTSHHRAGQSYCKPCHAASMRAWRKTHLLTPEQRRKDSARSYAQVYQKRGLLKRKPCKVCGDGKSEKHHPDYSRPLYVIWLCRKHHLELHARERAKAVSRKQIRNIPTRAAHETRGA